MLKVQQAKFPGAVNVSLPRKPEAEIRKKRTDGNQSKAGGTRTVWDGHIGQSPLFTALVEIRVLFLYGFVSNKL